MRTTRELIDRLKEPIPLQERLRIACQLLRLARALHRAAETQRARSQSIARAAMTYGPKRHGAWNGVPDG